jgi:4'-phosphopantetheinyl transferase
VLTHYTVDDDPEIVGDGAHGKPCLRDRRAGVHFNVSHAEGLVLVAVARGVRVGVDVERLGGRPFLSLPGNVLRPAERAALESLPGSRRDDAFLRLWACKEAVLKATGVGLAVDPALVEVSGPTQSPRVVALPSPIGPASRWALVDLRLPGYAAVLAVERPHAGITVLDRDHGRPAVARGVDAGRRRRSR